MANRCLFFCFLLLFSVGLYAQENRSKVGIRPLPRNSVEEKSGGGGVTGWRPGIGNYDELLQKDDFTAMNMDVVMDYGGAFQTRKRFFEHYIHHQGGEWVDTNPETNSLIRSIRMHENAGNTVTHIIIAREGWLYDPVNGDTGPIAGDPRILFQRDVDDQRQVFKDAHALGLIKHDNYKLIQMVLHPAVFLDDPEARAIISTMDGICYESHHYNRYWPLGSAISNPPEVARGARWVLEQGMDYIFYYGPYLYKECENYHEFLERDWLHSFWDEGLPKHHPNMYYYLNAFPHGCGANRPIGPESNPHSYLGIAKWLIKELAPGK